MIVAAEKRPKANEFEKLLQTTTDALTTDAKANLNYYLKRDGQDFEEDVFSVV